MNTLFKNYLATFLITFKIEAQLVLLHFTLLCLTGVAFLQIEGKTLHQQNQYDSLCCDTRSITVVWNRTRNISDVCLTSSSGPVPLPGNPSVSPE